MALLLKNIIFVARMLVSVDKTVSSKNVKLDEYTRIVYLIHMHARLHMPPAKWLKKELLSIYIKMLMDHISGIDISRGWIKTLSKSKYRYIYISKIRKFEWVKKQGKKYIFPETLVKGAMEIMAGGHVLYEVKL